MAVLLLICQDLVHGAVFFDDGFENNLMPNWTTGSCQYMGISGQPVDGCNPKITTEIAHLGSRSLRGDYTGACNLEGNPGADCGVWIDRVLPKVTTELYTRFYYRTANFTYYYIVTKHFYIQTAAGNPIVFTNWFGSRELSGGSQGEMTTSPPCSGTASGGPYNSCNYYPNVASIPLADNRWYCIETRVKMNTQGQANGILEIWVDGVQTAGYYNRAWTGVPSYDPGMKGIRLFVQGGKGLMYYDDFAAGDTRIGCKGSTPSDETAPNPPTGLKLQ